MEFTAEQIAEILQGIIVGDKSVKVRGLAKIEEGQPGALSFLSNPKYEEYIYSTKSSICIVNDTFEPSKDLPSSLTLIKVQDAYACFAKLLEVYNNLSKKQPEIETNSFIHSSAEVAEGLYLGSFSYISSNAKIGKNVIIYPNVFIGEGVEIGDNTILHPTIIVYKDCKVGTN